MSKKPNLKDKFAKWMGIDRKDVEWHPTIKSEKCDGCGLCVIGCGRNVFKYDTEKNTTIVENPF